MDPLSIGLGVVGGLGALGQIGLGAGQLAESKRVNELNYKAQQELLAWQKEQQMMTWSREDSAVQRRIADLKAAGLNPMLAAGSAAQSSSPAHLNAPMAEAPNYQGLMTGAMSMGNIAQTVASLLATNAQMKKTEAETKSQNLDNYFKNREVTITTLMDLLGTENPAFQGQAGEAQIRKASTIASLNKLLAENALVNYQGQLTKIGADTKNWDLSLAKERGVQSTSGANSVADLYQYAAKNGGQDALFMDIILKMLGGVGSAIPRLAVPTPVQ